MKTTKRFIAMAAALTLTACAAMPMASFAEATPKTVTITREVNNPVDSADHTYSAYKIFKGTVTDSGSLEGIDWVSNNVKSAVIAAINEKISNASDKLPADASALDAVGKLNAMSADDMKAIAVSLSKSTSNLGTAISLDGSTAVDTMEDGYYLIIDNASDTDGENYSVSFPMLQTYDQSKGLEITTKGVFPTVEKKIKENTKYQTDTTYGAGYNDTADFCIGDTVPFKLIGTIPDATTLGYYDTYKYIFHDTLGSQFTLANDFTTSGVTITIDGKTVTAGYTVEKDDDNNITITFNNLKAATITDLENTDANIGGKQVVVTYSATLNSTAIIGKPGQDNAVYLEYSNNPSQSGSGDTNNTGKTPTDKVRAFTYQLDVTKKDGTTQAALEGAKFVLKNDNNEFAKIENGKITGWVASQDSATVLESNVAGVFSIAGLDDGEYTLIETEAPTGYRLPTNPNTEFVISANTSNGQNVNISADGAELTALSITVAGETKNGTPDDGKVDMTVLNTSTASLPTTGGIGTTLFILGGGCAAGIAGIYLISKKKTREEE